MGVIAFIPARGGSKSIPENTTFIHNFSPIESVTWSLSGGADENKFKR